MKKMKQMAKRTLAVVLALMMCVGMLSVNAFATVSMSGNTLTMDVGDSSYIFVQESTGWDCAYCGGITRYASVGTSGQYYAGTASISTGVVGSFSTKQTYDTEYVPGWGTYEADDLELHFTALKGGTGTISWTYGVNFNRTSTQRGNCQFCGEFNISPADANWHYYTATQTVKVYDTFAMTFDANGGKFADGTTTQTVTKREAVGQYDFTKDAPVPTREGYTFKGWDGSMIVQSTTGDDKGSVTAIWEKDKDATLTVIREYYCGETKVGTVSNTSTDDKVGETVTIYAQSSWSQYRVNGVKYDFTLQSPAEQTITLVEDATKNVITFVYTRDHSDITYTDNGDGTHDGVCGACGETTVENENHVDDDHDDVCDKCGADLSEPCDHDNIDYTDNGDGTHDGTCSDCGELVVDGENHVDDDHDDVCDKCGADLSEPCDHDNIDYTDNGDGTHDGTCSDCGELVVDGENHVDDDHDDVCDKCGAEMPEDGDDDNNTPSNPDTPAFDGGFDMGGTVIEDVEVPLAGLFTRADAIGYLWQQAGEPEAELSDFADVAEDHQWAVAIGWAQDMGIAVADADGNFRPDDLVLRSSDAVEGELEQFLNRYAASVGVVADGELFIELDGEADEIVMGEDAQVIFDDFFARLEAALTRAA